jgi:hypothetical protein
VVIAEGVPNGFQSQTPYSHYSLPRTIETVLGLALVTADDGAATPMTDFFPAG